MIVGSSSSEVELCFQAAFHAKHGITLQKLHFLILMSLTLQYEDDNAIQ